MDGIALGIDALYVAVVSFLKSHGYEVIPRTDCFWLSRDRRFRSCQSDTFDLDVIPTIVGHLLHKDRSVTIHWAEVISGIVNWQQPASEAPVHTFGPWTIDCINSRYQFLC